MDIRNENLYGLEKFKYGLDSMSRCPGCGFENTNPAKMWRHGRFNVQAYICINCKAKYEEYYDVNGEHCLTLRLQRDKCYIKIWNLKKLLEE